MTAIDFPAEPNEALAEFLKTQGVIIEKLDRLERAIVARTERDFFSTAQAAARLNLSEWTVRQACNLGRIRGEKPNGRSWRVPLAEVERVEREGGLGPLGE